MAAAAILPENFRHRRFKLNDSKQLSAERREEIYRDLTNHSDIVWAVGVVDHLEIDRINILRATHEAMRIAVAGLTMPPDHALIDGLPVFPFPLPQTAVIDGDCFSLSIAAASVIAKVTRDRLMREFCARFPEYCFSQHKGYGTELHLVKLHEHGPCPIHRRSFEPVAQPLFALLSAGHLRLGARGEKLAARYLRRQGFKILYRNFRGRRGGEIDLVCRDRDTLVFVEVKTRTREDFGRPLDAVNRAEAAAHFVRRVRLAAVAG